MSRNELHDLAQATTPPDVSVPNTIVGLIVWATGRFGVGIVLASAFGWAVVHVYLDLQKLNDRVLTAFEMSASAAAQTASAIRELTKAIDEQEKK
jgi:hypothetical protein